jgi:SagB-type dehydrogenase family enzyme
VEPSYSKLFHEISKENLGNGGNPIPPNDVDWPEEWTTTYYKDYPRFPKIVLDDSAASAPHADLLEMIRNRRSARNFRGMPADKEMLSLILKYSCGITNNDDPEINARRAQPSGGARYPIEVYPLVFKGSPEVPAGLYHYNVAAHALDVLWERPFSEADIQSLFMYPYVKEASFALIMTAVFARTQMKYAERGYRYILIEAGHIGQNIYLTAGAAGLACTASGTWDRNLEKLIDIDGLTESPVYSLVVG